MPISTTFLALKMSAVLRGCGPSAVVTRKVASGILSPTLIVIVLSLNRRWSWFEPRRAHPIRVRGLVERGLDLDRLVSGDQREEELGRNARPAGRRAVNDEAEAELAVFRFDLFRQRQRPAIVRSLGKKIERAGGRRSFDERAGCRAALEPHAGNGEAPGIFTQGDAPRHAPLGLIEQAEGSALPGGYFHQQLRLGRNAELLAYGEIELELEPDRPRGIGRADKEGEDDMVVIADRLGVAFVDETLGRGPFDVDRGKIFRPGPVEARRHA